MTGCKVCKKTENLLKCGRCNSSNVQYCSKNCQKVDWSDHKAYCGSASSASGIQSENSTGNDSDSELKQKICKRLEDLRDSTSAGKTANGKMTDAEFCATLKEAINIVKTEVSVNAPAPTNSAKVPPKPKHIDHDIFENADATSAPSLQSSFNGLKIETSQKTLTNKDSKDKAPANKLPKKRPQYVDCAMTDHTSVTPKTHRAALRPGSKLREVLVYFGIFGDPEKPESEAYRIILPIPRYDLDILNIHSPATPNERSMVLRDIYDTITDIATRRKKSGICSNCGKDGPFEFSHNTFTGDPPVIKGKLPFAPFIFDVILPVCKWGNCKFKLEKIKERCSVVKNKELFQEMTEMSMKPLMCVINKGLWDREHTDVVQAGYEWRKNAFAHFKSGGISFEAARGEN